MIIELLVMGFLGIISIFLNALPSIPPLDDSILFVIADFFELLSMGKGLFFFLIRPQTAARCLGIALVIVNFDHIFKFLMFIARKIPFLNIQ